MTTPFAGLVGGFIEETDKISQQRAQRAQEDRLKKESEARILAAERSATAQEVQTGIALAELEAEEGITRQMTNIAIPNVGGGAEAPPVQIPFFAKTGDSRDERELKTAIDENRRIGGLNTDLAQARDSAELADIITGHGTPSDFANSGVQTVLLNTENQIRLRENAATSSTRSTDEGQFALAVRLFNDRQQALARNPLGADGALLTPNDIEPFAHFLAQAQDMIAAFEEQKKNQ